MKRWKRLNRKGKVLAILCVINLYCAFVLGYAGEGSAVFSFFVAMFCGLATYLPTGLKDK